MVIKKDLSDLPAGGTGGGRAPMRDPKVAPLIAQMWFDEYVENGQVGRAKAMPELPYRASWAGKRCDRELALAMTDTPESNPATLADYWRFGIGTMVHSALDRALARIPSARVEVVIDLRPAGIQGSANADAVTYEVDDDDNVILDKPKLVIEAKSVGGFAFKLAATTFNGPPQGPRFSAVVQGAMAASALRARLGLTVVDFSLENVAPNLAKYTTSEVGRFAAEWHYSLEECDQITADEARRIRLVTEMNEMGVLPPRELHDPEVAVGAVVTRPESGAWSVTIDGKVAESGSTWMCGYCNFRDECIAGGPGGVQ